MTQLIDAAAEYAQHERKAAAALARLAEADAWLADFMASIDAPAQPAGVATRAQEAG